MIAAELFAARSAALALIGFGIVAIMGEDTEEEFYWHLLILSMSICTSVFVAKKSGYI